jgi:predicted nucleic acid-binding protein
MASIYIDTNVFLDFYQSATDRMGIFQELQGRVDCIVFPEQTVREFRRNRAARLSRLADQVEKSAHVNIHTAAIIQELPDFNKWVDARDAAKNHATAIATQLRTWARDEASDPVYQEFVKLYTHGTTMSTSNDALAKAHARKLLGDPPTSPDKHTVGDELIWETLLVHCGNDLIIVSRDRTFLDNQSLLSSEFNIDGKRRLLAVTDRLGDALKLVGKPSITIEQVEKEDIQREAAARTAYTPPPSWLFGECNGCGKNAPLYPCPACHRSLCIECYPTPQQGVCADCDPLPKYFRG